MDVNDARKLVKAYKTDEWYLDRILKEIELEATAGKETMYCNELSELYLESDQGASLPRLYQFLIGNLEVRGFKVIKPRKPYTTHRVSWKQGG